MNKQEYILELIQKGHSDEEIELLVKDKFPEEEIIPFMPVPAGSAVITPQEFFDRLIKVDKQLFNKINLKLNNSSIKYHTDQVITFTVEQHTTKFADTTLFDKKIINPSTEPRYEYTAKKNITFIEMGE